MFEPEWTFKLGQSAQQGVGLLYPLVWKLPYADVFSVRLNGTQLVCRPKQGQISQNLQPVMQVSPGKLIWSRRIQMELSTNSRGALKRCLFYRLGIENASGQFGIRIYEDGRVEQGLE